ncbi:MAG: mechanosensitive ion channel [Parvularculaceae bacterium]
MKRLFIFVFLAALPVLAYAQTGLAEREAAITQATKSIAALSSDLHDDGVDDAAQFERDVREILAAAQGRLRPVSDQLRRAEDNLNLLGPAPKEGSTEPPSVASERANYQENVSALRGQQTRILANIDAANALLSELSGRRLRDLYSRVLKRDRPLFSASLWADGLDDAGDLSSAVGRFFTKWGASKQGSGGAPLGVLGIGAAFIVFFLLFGPVGAYLRRLFTNRLEAFEPTSNRRIAAAGVTMLARLIPGLVGGVVIIWTSQALGLLGEQGVPVARTLWIALIGVLSVGGFLRGLLTPAAEKWRLAAIDTANGRAITRIIIAIMIIIGVKAVLVSIAGVADIGDSAIELTKGVSATVIGALLFVLCSRQYWRREEGEDQTSAVKQNNKARIPAVRAVVRTFAIAIAAAAIAGHVNLADFISSRLYYFAIIAAFAWFARAALKELAAFADRRLSDGATKGDDEQTALQFWIGAVIDFVLALAIAPVLALLLGVDLGAVRDFVMRAFIGFRVGGVVISLGDIFFAIAIFAGILTLTRFLQAALQKGPLAHSRIDPGIQNSLITLFGYAGLVVAAFVGVSVLGFDLSNLALIAGALSVGIGFGLQSIVNNFVSGLILLFERPIKQGDWIVTASGEGIVKKISVRSTEIETFDRSSIIIPNSELVASTVTNWTHKNNIGRIRVAVGVAYGSDADQVRDILLKCGNDHPLIARYPEPFVVWDDFGDSSLNFELRAFLGDIGSGLRVKTDLRFSIYRAFNEAGIEIPFPQRDLHIRSAPGLAEQADALKQGPKGEDIEKEATKNDNKDSGDYGD